MSNTDIDSNKVSDPDLVMPTVDTVTHQEILCGGLVNIDLLFYVCLLGSGKTMTLMEHRKC